jgi:hypothetical protein
MAVADVWTTGVYAVSNINAASTDEAGIGAGIAWDGAELFAIFVGHADGVGFVAAVEVGFARRAERASQAGFRSL